MICPLPILRVMRQRHSASLTRQAGKAPFILCLFSLSTLA
jgi:hypothetical protein